MIRQQMNRQARITRRVTVQNRSFTVYEFVDAAWFPCQLVPSTDTRPAEEASPRSHPAARLRFMDGYRAPVGGVPQGGARVEIQGEEEQYELLPDPRPLYWMSKLEAWEARALPLSTLYPIQASLHAQDGTQVAAAVACAIYGGSDERQERGTYEALNAEADASVALLVQENSYFVVDGRKYRILERVLDTVGPHIRMSVRSVAPS